MRALITRPEEDAAPLAEALKARNVEVSVEPLLTIRVIDDVAVDLDGVQALLFTSANGVRAFAERSARRDIGVLTVGDASATAARAAGFNHVESAGGDVGDLVRLVKQRLDPQNGALFHAAGSVVAGDLAGQLAEAGFELRRVMLYEAKPAETLTPETLSALADRAIDLVLFFSPRTATTFVELLRKADDPQVMAGCAGAAALCLSPNVAEAARVLAWKSVASAERPDLPSMLRLVEEAGVPRETITAEPAAPAEPAEPATPAVPAMPAVPPQAAPARSGGAVIAAATSAVLVTVAGLATEPMWRPYLAGIVPAPETPAPAPDAGLAAGLDAVKAQAQELAQRIAALDGMVQQLYARGAGAGSDMADMGARLDALQKDIAALRHDVDAVAAMPAPSGAPAAIPDDIAGLPEQVRALKQQLAALAALAAAAAAPAESGPSPELAAAIDTLRRQVDALEITTRDLDAWKSGIESRLAATEALEPRVARLEQATSAAESRATGNATLALAVNQLQSALATARPFAAELAALKDVAAADPEAAAQVEAAAKALAPRAEAGLPTLVELRAGFPEIARAVVAAARAEQAAAAVATATTGNEAETPGWLDAAMLKLSDLVSVRPVGEDVAGDDAAARVARAEAVLGKGDLAGALAELDKLTGDAAATAASWIADARARLDAEAALAALQALAVARLAPSGSGG